MELGCTFIPFKDYHKLLDYQASNPVQAPNLADGGTVLDSSLPGNRGKYTGALCHNMCHHRKIYWGCGSGVGLGSFRYNELENMIIRFINPWPLHYLRQYLAMDFEFIN